MNGLKLHHIGVATKSIEKELETFSKLGYVPCSEVFCDKIQKIKGLFISAPHQPCMELLENLTPDGPLTSHLKAGRKFYHIAYETENIETSYEKFIQGGGVYQFSRLHPQLTLKRYVL